MFCSGIGGNQGPDCIKSLAETPKTQSLILLVGATITVVGILLVSLMPMAPNIGSATTMRVLGNLFLFTATPLLSAGIMLMIYSKCVLGKPWKEYLPETSCNCPSLPQSTATPRTGLAISPFQEKMEAILPEGIYEQLETKNIDKPATELKKEDLEEKNGMKGTDSANCSYVALVHKRNLWVFKQLNPDQPGTNVWKRGKEFSLFGNQTLFNQYKRELASFKV